MIDAGDVVLGVLPLFHVYGLNAVLGSVLRHGATLVLVDRFDPRGTLDVIADHGVTVVPVAPAVFPHWLGLDDLGPPCPPSGWCVGFGAAGAAGDRGVHRATGIPVHQGYGLTEAAPVVTSTLASRDACPARSGAPSPASGCGWSTTTARSPRAATRARSRSAASNLFSGYWPDGADGPGPDGWWSTGDVGFLDDDGDLFLVDRAAEVVVVAGFRVYPHEVEAVIGQVPGVEEAAVIGVPDDATGHAVVAYVRAPGPSRRRRRGRARRATGAGRLQATHPGRGRRPAADDAGRPGPQGRAAPARAPPCAGDAGVTERDARVVMYGRPGCHLCEVAAETIARVCADLGEEWVEISIDDDAALREEYGEEIPVTLVDGRRHDFWRVDEARLRAALAAEPRL